MSTVDHVTLAPSTENKDEQTTIKPSRKSLVEANSIPKPSINLPAHLIPETAVNTKGNTSQSAPPDALKETKIPNPLSQAGIGTLCVSTALGPQVPPLAKEATIPGTSTQVCHLPSQQQLQRPQHAVSQQQLQQQMMLAQAQHMHHMQALQATQDLGHQVRFDMSNGMTRTFYIHSSNIVLVCLHRGPAPPTLPQQHSFGNGLAAMGQMPSMQRPPIHAQQVSINFND